MISLKRNSKLELVEAPGKRIRASSIYTPGQSDDFKLSRGKFSNFITCPRCFYLDRVKGLASGLIKEALGISRSCCYTIVCVT